MWVTLGRSVEGRALLACVRPGPAGLTTMVFGGFHGDEPKGVDIARRLAERLVADPTVGLDTGWVIVPLVNPDGYERRRRRNANGVDLNRNFPTENWTCAARRSRMFGGTVAGSEPETQAVIDAVESYQPLRIITIHSINHGRHCNNYDGPGEGIATAMHRANRYPVTSSIGYVTPGSFGTWAGLERGIPTITLELPSRHSPKRCWEANRAALLASY